MEEMALEKGKVSVKFISLLCFMLVFGILSPAIPVFAEETQETTTTTTENVEIQENNQKETSTSTKEEKQTDDSELSTDESVTNSESSQEKKNKPTDFNFSIMHTNDMHGRMQYEDGKVIGLAKLKTFKDSKNPTLMLDSGDAMQGLAISNFGKGMDMVRAMSHIPYDAVAVGNHEFDFGYDQAMAYQQILPMVSANVEKNGKESFKPYKMIEKDGKKFAVIGLSTPETAFKTHPDNVKNVTFADPIPVAKKMMEQLKGKADVFVFLSHLGVDQTTPVEWRGDTLAKNLSETYPKEKIVVLDGHSHTALPTGQTYGNVLLAQTGNYLNNVGLINISYNGENPTFKAELIPASEFKDIKEDETIKKIIDETKQKFDDEMNQVVLENNPVQFEGQGDNVRTRETNLGNIIADSLYDYGQTGFKNGQTDLAVINGGGIRTNINKGKVTKGDILAVLPFGNTISQIDVTGKEIKEMFEYSLRSEVQKDKSTGQVMIDETTKQPILGRNGGFLQVSDSVKIHYDSTKQGAGNKPEDNQAGQRVWSIKIKNKATGEFERLDESKMYKLATNDFLAAGGDGYTMLGGSREEGPSLDQVFTDFLSDISVDKSEKILPIRSAKYAIMDYEKAIPYSRIIPSETSEDIIVTTLEELEKTITESKKLSESDYTVKSWIAFSEELVKAEKVLTDKDESKAKEINNALVKQKEALVSIKTLKALVKETDRLKEVDYTVNTWHVLTNALTEANKVLTDAQSKEIDVTVDTVKEVEEALTKAIKNLAKATANNTTKNKPTTTNSLPKTGEKVFNFVSIGLILTAVASAAYVFKNKAS